MLHMKRLLLHLVTIMFGLVLGLSLVELAFRVARITPERYARPTWAAWYNGSYQATGIWGNIRDASGRVQVPYLVKRPSRFADQRVQMGEYVPGAVYKCIYATNPRDYFDADGGVVMTVNQIGMRTGRQAVSQANCVVRRTSDWVSLFSRSCFGWTNAIRSSRFMLSWPAPARSTAFLWSTCLQPFKEKIPGNSGCTPRITTPMNLRII